MQKDWKILAGSILFTFLLIVGLVLWQGRGGLSKTQVLSDGSGIELSPQPSDWGEIQINGGIVTREFEIKNTSERSIKLKKIVTSCMCTTAAVKIGEESTRFFGMEMSGDKNPPVNMEIDAGEVAKIIVKFDPAAHGPQGVGPFERIVWLTFSDPAGVKELKFNGRVVQ
ncbi:DUF1573 domain-containing protein [Candidatus Microgenomates bacterium]|nr:DUF1573 domain-containing protein [Candidatus Microgenomates bacterium]